MRESIFDKISTEWWDKNGPMKMLHSMNETRILFIKERIINKYQKVGSYKTILEKKTILDLGLWWRDFIRNSSRRWSKYIGN